MPAARLMSKVELNPNFQDGPTSTLRRGVEQADHSVAQLVHPCRHVDGSHSRSACAVRGPVVVRLDSPTALFLLRPPFLMVPGPRVGLSITSGATRAARCARESAERGFSSSSFRRAAG